jgi:hypothetical protein
MSDPVEIAEGTLLSTEAVARAEPMISLRLPIGLRMRGTRQRGGRGCIRR